MTANLDTVKADDQLGPGHLDDHPCCQARIGDLGGFGCTRTDGHQGQHVATTSTGRVITTWPNT